WPPESNVNWLKDLLPAKIPNARIFSLGYDAKTHSESPVIVYLERTTGVGIVSNVSLYLGDTGRPSNAPLFFVACNLGGIVMKSARAA
ncbi:hypothetical protein K469DRAFT_520395, partial [Zopfia rhizophila CBS 207.26]